MEFTNIGKPSSDGFPLRYLSTFSCPSSRAKNTFPRASFNCGQPSEMTASRKVLASPRTSSGVIILLRENTLNVSASRASNAASVKSSAAIESGYADWPVLAFSMINIGTCSGLLSDQSRISIKHLIQVGQVERTSISCACRTLNPGAYMSEGS